MTHVTVGPNYMTIEGHAGDTIVCAMITSQIVGLVKNLAERLNEDFDFVLIPGFFDIRTDTLSDEGKSLANVRLAFFLCQQTDFLGKIVDCVALLC